MDANPLPALESLRLDRGREPESQAGGRDHHDGEHREEYHGQRGRGELGARSGTGLDDDSARHPRMVDADVWVCAWDRERVSERRAGEHLSGVDFAYS